MCVTLQSLSDSPTGAIMPLNIATSAWSTFKTVVIPHSTETWNRYARRAPCVHSAQKHKQTPLAWTPLRRTQSPWSDESNFTVGMLLSVCKTTMAEHFLSSIIMSPNIFRVMASSSLSGIWPHVGTVDSFVFTVLHLWTFLWNEAPKYSMKVSAVFHKVHLKSKKENTA